MEKQKEHFEDIQDTLKGTVYAFGETQKEKREKRRKKTHLNK